MDGELFSCFMYALFSNECLSTTIVFCVVTDNLYTILLCKVYFNQITSFFPTFTYLEMSVINSMVV